MFGVYRDERSYFQTRTPLPRDCRIRRHRPATVPQRVRAAGQFLAETRGQTPEGEIEK